MASSATGLNWDDLRLVLAVAEHGTLSAAAVALRISHPTLSRRCRLVEDRLGVRLFERMPGGWTLTDAGEDMCVLALRMRGDIAALEERIAGRDDNLHGSVRLTAPDAVSDHLLPAILADLCRELPRITIDLVVNNQTLPLARRSADIALRVTNSPDPALKGRRVGTIAMAVHAEAALAARHADPVDGPWVGYDDALACSGPGAWITAELPPDAIRFRANTLPGAAQAIRAGIGFGLLPCFVGAALPDVVRVAPPVPELSTELWLLVHPQMARVPPRVRAVGDALAGALKALAPRLSGDDGL
ncbi:LysR family transcriptional regulator [Tistrella bauzanensis]|uniref:LysR family transcriptional regulator n=1 Tax=Tistrella TaxID=171436 RepID=UPI0031F683C1